MPKTDYAADSPIVTLSADALKRRGAITLDVALNRLPQVVPSFSSAANNPSAYGASYVNLRGLGVSRNLVLLDGQRVVGANASGSVDLNTVPSALVERVEVITGGASAVYGADAVAGVVNIRLKERFEGFEADGRTLVSQRGDSAEHEASLTGGHHFGDLDLMASVGWARRDELGKGARPFSAQASGPSRWNPTGDWFPAPNGPSQAAVNAVFGAYGTPPGTVSRTGGAGGFSFNADGTLFATGLPNGDPANVVNYRGSHADIVESFFPDVYAYNYQPFNKLILPLDRWSGFASARWRASDRMSLWGQFLVTRYSTATALAPSPAPTDLNPVYPGTGISTFLIPVTNPFIPHDLAVLLASRTGNSPALPGAGPTEDFQYRFRTVALGPRQSDVTVDLANLSGGLRVDLGGDWRAEATGGWGRYTRTEDQDGLLSVRRFQAILSSPTGGKDLCEGGVDPFGGFSLSDSCKTYLDVSARFTTHIRLATAQASVTGPLWRLPAGPVLAVAGAEYRRVSYVFTPPAGISPGDVSGFTPLSPLSGAIATGDLFFEANAPLVADRPLMHRVEATVGYRLSGDAGAGIVHSWKAELGWSFTPSLRLRAAFQRAVRSPDIFERFEPATGNAGLAVDPCAPGVLRTAQVLVLCANQATALGFVPGDLDLLTPGEQGVAVTDQGTASLRPEAARTLTAGLVFQGDGAGPWFGTVQASLDGWDIRIDNAIGYGDPQLALNACYNIGGGNPTFDPASAACAPVQRSAVDFTINDVLTPRANEARLSLAGIDASLAWRTDLAEIGAHPWLGRLATTIQIGWLARFDQQDSSLRPAIDFAGTIADANTGYESLPRWKGLVAFAWTSGPVEADLAGRYIGPMAPRNRLTDPTDTFSTGVGAAWYWDVSARWDLSARTRISAGVLNLFDRGPELYQPNVDAGTEPSTYDVIGRRFWVALTLRL